tara:strand:- start:311 stop:1684 length:1374 start_codon:yes stop_codon:yes gene_type:complete
MSTFGDSVTGQARVIANEGFKRVTGNLRGVIDNAINDLNPISRIFDRNKSKNKLDPKAFSFPLDVTNSDPGLGNHGHYILFFINEQKDAKISFGRDEFTFSGSGFLNLIESRIEHGISNKVNDFVDTQVGRASDFVSNIRLDRASEVSTAERAFLSTGIGGKGLKKNTSSLYNSVSNFVGFDSIIEGYSKAGLDFVTDKLGFEKYGSTISSSRNTAIVKRPATTRLDTAIALYMPPTINVTYASNYVDTEIGAGANFAGEEINKWMNTSGSSPEKIASLAKTTLKSTNTKEFSDFLRKTALGAAGVVPGMQGAREAYEMKTGVVMTNRMELAFKGLPKRSFQYSFKMIPKSEKEANEVRNIVTAFKLNMLPEMKDSSIKRLKVPNTFDIKYMYIGKENEYLHKISTCVLENMNVTYGGDRYRTFESNDEGAPPVETTMTLNFKEMEQITKERAEEGF